MFKALTAAFCVRSPVVEVTEKLPPLAWIWLLIPTVPVDPVMDTEPPEVITPPTATLPEVVARVTSEPALIAAPVVMAPVLVVRFTVVPAVNTPAALDVMVALFVPVNAIAPVEVTAAFMLILSFAVVVLILTSPALRACAIVNAVPPCSLKVPPADDPLRVMVPAACVSLMNTLPPVFAVKVAALVANRPAPAPMSPLPETRARVPVATAFAPV